MSDDALGLGYSTCPNDTFMFHALVTGAVASPTRFAPWLADIEALNRRALGRDALPPLPITKISVATLGHLTARYAVLSAGAALGHGCGPLVLRRADGPPRGALADLRGARVAIPGVGTTANLLLTIFGPPGMERVVMRFEEIMPAVAAGAVDAGVVIHESRFTYPDHGLALLADLGQVWEAETTLPLPLGVIVAERSLGSRAAEIEASLAASVRFALADPEASAPTVAAHAQEMAPEVCRQHIALYVNAFSAELGTEGRAAIEQMLERGKAVGMLPRDASSPWR